MKYEDMGKKVKTDDDAVVTKEKKEKKNTDW